MCMCYIVVFPYTIIHLSYSSTLCSAYTYIYINITNWDACLFSGEAAVDIYDSCVVYGVPIVPFCVYNQNKTFVCCKCC